VRETIITPNRPLRTILAITPRSAVSAAAERGDVARATGARGATGRFARRIGRFDVRLTGRFDFEACRLAAADVVGFFFVVLRRVCESSGSAVIAASRTTAAIRSFLYNNGPYWASVFSGTLLCYTANANFTPDTAFYRNREGLPHG